MHGNQVFCAVNSGFPGHLELYELDVNTGETVWSQSGDEISDVGPLTYAKGKLYLQTFQKISDDSDGSRWRTRCVSAQSGEQIWSTNDPFESYQALGPLVAADTVWSSASLFGGGGLAATRSADGSFLFATREQGYFVGYQRSCDLPAFAQDLVFTYANGIFVATYPRVGYVAWSLRLAPYFDSRAEQTPVVSDQTAYIADGANLTAIDLPTRRQKWQQPGQFGMWDSARGGIDFPAVDAEAVYVYADRRVFAFSTAAGHLLATYNAPESIERQTVVTDDLVITGSRNATYLFRKSDQKLIQTLPIAGMISYANGQLLIVGNFSSSPLSAFSNRAEAVGANPVEAPMITATTPAKPGLYTLLLNAKPKGTAEAPMGRAGFGVLTIDENARADLVLILPDGHKAIAKGSIDADQRFIITKPLYGSEGGFVEGSLSYAELSDCDWQGTIHWKKPKNQNPIYPAAADQILNAVGSYNDQSIPSILPSHPKPNAFFYAAGAGKYTGKTKINITKNNLVTDRDPNPDLAVHFRPSLGIVSGQLTRSYETSYFGFTFIGAIYQKANVAAGITIGPGGLGWFTIGTGEGKFIPSPEQNDGRN